MFKTGGHIILRGGPWGLIGLTRCRALYILMSDAPRSEHTGGLTQQQQQEQQHYRSRSSPLTLSRKWEGMAGTNEESIRHSRAPDRGSTVQIWKY